MALNEKQWSQLNKRLEAVEQSIFDDRKSLDRMQIDMASLKETMNRILGMQVRGQEKITKAVEEAIQPTTELMEELADKKIIKVSNKKTENISIWRKIQFWNRK